MHDFTFALRKLCQKNFWQFYASHTHTQYSESTYYFHARYYKKGLTNIVETFAKILYDKHCKLLIQIIIVSIITWDFTSATN